MLFQETVLVEDAQEAPTIVPGLQRDRIASVGQLTFEILLEFLAADRVDGSLREYLIEGFHLRTDVLVVSKRNQVTRLFH